MPALALLALALIALVIGLVTSSGIWLIGAASLVALAALLGILGTSRAAPTAGAMAKASRRSRTGEASTPHAGLPLDKVMSQLRAEPDAATTSDTSTALLTVTPVPVMSEDMDQYTPLEPLVPEVWVVDAMPEYHVFGCSTLSAAAEPIPYDQAISDGFTPCTECHPDLVIAHAVITGEPRTPANSSAVDEVWVMDGEADYHLVLCSLLDDRAEAVPFEQSLEDGFTPCALCDPDADRVAPTVQPAHWYEAPEPERLLHAVPNAYEAESEGEHAEVDDALVTQAVFAAVLGETLRQAEPEPAAVEPELVADEAVVVLAAVADESAEEQPEAAPEPEAAELALEREPEPAFEPTFAPVLAGPTVLAPSGPDPFAHALSELEGPMLGVLATDVWVIDGKLRYHQRGCLMIKYAVAVPMPREQAVAGGFRPCPLCTP